MELNPYEAPSSSPAEPATGTRYSLSRLLIIAAIATAAFAYVAGFVAYIVSEDRYTRATRERMRRERAEAMEGASLPTDTRP